MNNQSPTSLSQDMTQLCRGLCMGCADVVPGVSGGTVALILGIYRRLVTAISRVDRQLWQLARSGQWAAALNYLDVRFLVALGAGIGVGLVGMSLLINRLLNDAFTRSLTWAAFFGMILASALLIAGLVDARGWRQQVRCAVLGLAAAALACWLALLPLPTTHDGHPSFLWLFACGGVAICAMILPGISGAMILLILGVYEHLTEVPKNLLSGQQLGASFLTLLVFGSGCAISLILFSKVLRWLLTEYHSETIAILCGFMFGALPKLWPFQRDTTPAVEKFKEKTFELYWPDRMDGAVAAALATALAAAAFVVAVDWLIRQRHPRESFTANSS